MKPLTAGDLITAPSASGHTRVRVLVHDTSIDSHGTTWLYVHPLVGSLFDGWWVDAATAERVDPDPATDGWRPTRAELFERDHPDAPDNPKQEIR